MFAWVAGCLYISTFIAGATKTGVVVASAISLRRLSARPRAILAIVWAVAGAIRRAAASRATAMWEISGPEADRSVSTGEPVNASKVRGVTNLSAAGVMTTRTRTPPG